MAEDPTHDEKIDAMIRQQAHAARRAGNRDDLIAPLSEEELDAPLDVDPVHSQSHDPHVAFEGYQIKRALSRGGQASVYEAIQEATGRRVAVKVIAGGPYITSQSRARFEREVKILASLDHPGIVRIVDRGRTFDGSFFLVMNYVDGLNLDDHLAANRDRLSQRDVIQLIISVLRALEAAHRQGVVHRDLKPSNIRVDQYNQTHILDFGLAGLEEEDTFGTTITRSGNVIGSLPWASPEQASGNVREISAESDIYSIGVVLYQSLTGTFPYPVNGTLQEVTRNICKKDPLSPDKCADSRFGRVDPVLSATILRTIAKDPQKRFSSSTEFHEELERYLNGVSSIRIRQPKRNIFASLVLCVAVGGVLLALRPWQTNEDVSPVNLRHSFDSVGMEFVNIPPGQFWMGSLTNEVGHNNDEVHHMVKLTHGFRIAVSETTRAQYKQVMGKLPDGVEDDSPDLPVDRVSRDDAEAFCQKLSSLEHKKYRLPTEAEWEFACRAGTTSRFSGEKNLGDVAWYQDNSHDKLHPVKSLKPNRWGLYDMLGNVSEWCLDAYVPNPGPDLKIDPADTTPGTGVLRGGSAWSTESQSRCASRVPKNPPWRDRGLGFRVVMVDSPATRKKSD